MLIKICNNLIQSRSGITNIHQRILLAGALFLSYIFVLDIIISRMYVHMTGVTSNRGGVTQKLSELILISDSQFIIERQFKQ